MLDSLFGTKIIEAHSAKFASYIIKDEELFYDIGFRVMKNQENGPILSGYKVKMNGYIKLDYFTEDYVSLMSYLSEKNFTNKDTVIDNMYKSINEVVANGFLNIVCIDSRIERIYVDTKTLDVKLIYLPVNLQSDGMAVSEFENKIKKQLDAIDINGETSVLEAETINEDELHLVSCIGNWKLVVNKEEFTIGKSPDKVDGVIPGNSAISRVHCKIAHSWNGKYYIVDMNSSNGTYLNGLRVPSDQYLELNEGDIIRIANEEFIVGR